MKISNIVVGSLFIIFGVALGISLLTKLEFEFWPFFVLIPGLVFEISFFKARGKADPGMLVPGGILTVIGVFFFFQTLTGWKLMVNTWPVFMLAVAVGLFQLYLFGNKDKGLLKPITILTGLFVIFTASSLNILKDYFKYIGPIIIIILGAVIILKGKKGQTMPDVTSVTPEDPSGSKDNSQSDDAL